VVDRRDMREEDPNHLTIEVGMREIEEVVYPTIQDMFSSTSLSPSDIDVLGLIALIHFYDFLPSISSSLPVLRVLHLPLHLSQDLPPLSLQIRCALL